VAVNRIFLSSLIAVGVLGGCVAEEATSSTEQFAKPCPSFGCGENSPIMGPYNIPELHTRQLPNTDGVVLRYYQQGNSIYQVDIQNSKMVALYPGTNIIAVQGAALAGGYLVLAYPGSTNLPAGEAHLWFNHVSSAGQNMWVGSPTPVETYELLYDGAGSTARTPVCKRPPDSKVQSAIDPEGRLWANRFESIFFTGDRYDPDHLTVSLSSPQRGLWFNIACAGSAPAKLFLNRHTSASSAPNFTTTLDQRQAMLKMYSGDFCGDGVAYTVMGTPIHWTSASGLSSPPGNQTSYESLWDSHGAICMDLHRLTNSPDPTYAAFAETIRNTCNMKKCDLNAITNPPVLNSTSPYIVTQSPAH
jgi:ADYC domain